MKYLLSKTCLALIIVLGILSVPTFSLALATPAGLVDSGIWIDKEPKVNETVTIYSAIFNGYDKTLSGSVQFYDYDTLLGEKNFSLSPKTISTVSISWKANVGDHKIEARVLNPMLKNGDGQTATFLDWNKTNELKLTVAPSFSPTVSSNISSDTNEPSFVSGIVDGISNFVAEKTPDGVQEATISIFEPVETFRIKEANALAIKKDEVKKEYDAMKNTSVVADTKSPSTQNQDEPKENKLQRPLKMLQLAGVSAAKIVFNSPYIFYSLFVIIAFLVLRAIWRWFRNKDFRGSRDD